MQFSNILSVATAAVVVMAMGPAMAEGIIRPLDLDITSACELKQKTCSLGVFSASSRLLLVGK